MAGPAIGDRLFVRYLTYQNHVVVKFGMPPVLSDAGNFLFAEVFYPEADIAQIDAASALASMQVLRGFIDL
ncbi:hypothetical protein [Solemya velum gill symbiont]|uniref:Uncharacterized protein n=1 Tax=Solemya velum gill symbiont TaxID=2340 RepID=A0A0B0H504_SOVGS|nr:hypothetical protein [Solemya velum gill symbiont]KHF24215.1 hypothetical protein JV46_26620 [Solemya velum gill symbiont]OOY36051.1 hypothetical protein BOV88_00090 [Solemya velum gill symbiont]OOY36734.1 hypothetical protein BOV89_11105 [Solemya velum gill symbiont]OOY39533.1 hypothetical protein BOV90_08905 [Solemya velum gill symbiont]OOY45126.1 hypothetical protein BOV92_06555 [Solemya velum gill symbiont]